MFVSICLIMINIYKNYRLVAQKFKININDKCCYFIIISINIDLIIYNLKLKRLHRYQYFIRIKVNVYVLSFVTFDFKICHVVL